MNHFLDYSKRLHAALELVEFNKVEYLAEELYDLWRSKRTFFLCGNGGSAGNAIHLANDFNYGISKKDGIGMRVDALPANSSVVTCLANDIGYDKIFSQQLSVKANKDDILLVLSGSGNSPNVVNALNIGNEIGMKTFAILGYDGGKCKSLAQVPIHIPVNDMQISEDLQVIIGHMIMQWICEK